MQNYNRAIVSKSETEALKEMIFNRARQRAAALAQETQNQYTSSFKDEIMDIARSSFNAPGNPFAQKIAETNTETNIKPKKQTQIGFEQKQTDKEINQIIKSKNDITKEIASQREISHVMQTAATEFENTKQFVGALNFLNAQAGINLADRRKARFEIIA